MEFLKIIVLKSELMLLPNALIYCCRAWLGPHVHMTSHFIAMPGHPAIQNSYLYLLLSLLSGLGFAFYFFCSPRLNTFLIVSSFYYKQCAVSDRSILRLACAFTIFILELQSIPFSFFLSSLVVWGCLKSMAANLSSYIEC